MAQHNRIILVVLSSSVVLLRGFFLVIFLCWSFDGLSACPSLTWGLSQTLRRWLCLPSSSTTSWIRKHSGKNCRQFQMTSKLVIKRTISDLLRLLPHHDNAFFRLNDETKTAKTCIIGTNKIFASISQCENLCLRLFFLLNNINSLYAARESKAPQIFFNYTQCYVSFFLLPLLLVIMI